MVKGRRRRNEVGIIVMLSCMQGRRKTTLIGGGVFIELPEYAIFIKLPEFYWMH